MSWISKLKNTKTMCHNWSPFNIWRQGWLDFSIFMSMWTVCNNYWWKPLDRHWKIGVRLSSNWNKIQIEASWKIYNAETTSETSKTHKKVLGSDLSIPNLSIVLLFWKTLFCGNVGHHNPSIDVVWGEFKFSISLYGFSWLLQYNLYSSKTYQPYFST